jgi:hypothetical protein
MGARAAQSIEESSAILAQLHLPHEQLAGALLEIRQTIFVPPRFDGLGIGRVGIAEGAGQREDPGRRTGPHVHFVNVYSAPQYGHFAQPVCSMGRYTRGCEFQRYISGMGQDNGRSLASTLYSFCAFGWMSVLVADMAGRIIGVAQAG